MNYAGLILQAALKHRVDPAFALQISTKGERFNPANPTSPKGATGSMQVMPGTFAEVAKELPHLKDINDPGDNAEAGVYYLKKMLQRFNHPVLAAAAYNAGPGAVEKYGGVPPYKETRGYVERIFGSGAAEAAEIPKNNVIEAELPDGTILEFPAGTSKEVIQSAVKRKLAGEQETPFLTLSDPMGQSLEQDYPMRRKIMSVLRPLIEGAGMVGGGALGTPAGPAGNAVMGGVGYVAGKEVSDTIEELLGIRKPEPVLQQAKDMYLRDLPMGIAMQGAGELATPYVQKVLAPLRSKMTPAAINAYKVAEQENVPIPAADLNEYKPSAMIQSVLDKFPFTSGYMQKKDVEQLQGLMRMRRTLLDMGSPETAIQNIDDVIRNKAEKVLGSIKDAKTTDTMALRDAIKEELGVSGIPTQEGLGKSVQSNLESLSQYGKNRIANLYDTVKNMAPQGRVIDGKPLQKRALQLIKDEAQASPELRGGINLDLLKRYSGLDDDVIKHIMSHPQDADNLIADALQNINPKFSWTQLHQDRKALNEIIRTENAALGTNVPGTANMNTAKGGAAKFLKSGIDESMTAYSDSTGGALKTVFDRAKAENAYWKDLFDNTEMRGLLRKHPEKVVDYVIRPGDATIYKTIQTDLGPAGIKPLKDAFTSKLLQLDVDEFSPTGLANSLKRYGNGVLETVYSQDEVVALKELASEKGIEKLPVGNPFLRKMVKENATAAYKLISRPGNPNNVRNIKLMKTILSGDEFNSLKTEFLARELLPLNEHGMLRTTPAAKRAFRYGEDTIRAWLSDEELSYLNERLLPLLRYSYRADKVAGNPSGTAQNLITFEAGRMAVTNPGTLAQLWIGAKGLAKLITSKAGRQWLTVGFQIPPKGKMAINTFAKLAEIAGYDSMTNPDELYYSGGSGREQEANQQ